MVPERARALIVPREHGAWGILLVPLVTGACAGLISGGGGSGLIPLTILALALFWLRTPVESWMGTTPVRARTAEESRLVRVAVLMLAAVAVAAAVWLFWGGRNAELWKLGGAAAAAFGIQALLRRAGWRMAAQIVGAAGLTATAPAAFYAARGIWDAAGLLWAANWCFAANQIHYVQLRIHAARASSRREKLRLGWGFLAGQAVLTGLLAAYCVEGGRGGPALAFLPILTRGYAWFLQPPQPLVIHRLGKSELAHACAFGLLLVLGFWLTH
jgi:hypothetical protein